jgi:hypothetical protein
MFLVLETIFLFEMLNNNVLMCVYLLVNMNYEGFQLKNISFKIWKLQYYIAEENRVILQ